MYPLVRLAWHCLGATRRTRSGFLDEFRLPMRVWPTDLDINFHVNNGRYLTLMDLGRFDMMVRLGMVAPAWRQGWFPVVGNATITYRASLAPFQAYELATRVVAWDKKWIFIQQDFLVGERLFARGVIRAQIRRRASGVVPPQELLGILGHPDVASPALPPELVRWVEGLRLTRLP